MKAMWFILLCVGYFVGFMVSDYYVNKQLETGSIKPMFGDRAFVIYPMVTPETFNLYLKTYCTEDLNNGNI